MRNASCDKTICLFSALYAPSMGGVETYTENLARALVALGWRTIVVTMDTHGAGSGNAEATDSVSAATGLQADERSQAGEYAEAHSYPTCGSPATQDDSGVEVLRLPCRNALGGRYPLPHRNDEYRRMVTWLAAQAPRYVVVNTRFYELSIEGLAFARRLGVTPVLIEHGSAHLTMGGAATSKAVEAVEHLMTMRAKRHKPACYAVSKKASAWLSHFGIESHGELPNAIDADAYAAAASARDFRAELSIPDSALLVASAGRLVPEKGVLQLAQAAGKLEGDDSRADVHVVMAGAGPLEAQVAEMGCSKVHLVGKLNRADMAALLTQADAYCLPSRSEGFATTLLEAAACGTPAIVTNVGGTDELICDERFGTIIADMEADTIAAALENAAGNREQLAEQGRNVAARVRQICSWDRTAKLTLAACERENASA